MIYAPSLRYIPHRNKLDLWVFFSATYHFQKSSKSSIVFKLPWLQNQINELNNIL